MKFFLKFAWRNIWRNKRRTLITILAVMFATSLTVVMRGLQLGSYAYFIRTIAGDYSGYIQIQRAGYKDDPSLRKTFHFTEDIKNLLDSNRDVVAYSPRLFANVLVSSGENSYGGLIYGVDPNFEVKYSNFHNKIVKGKFLNSSSSGEVVLGYKLFQNLRLNIGDEVVILGQGIDGGLCDGKFKVVGVVKLGYTELDNMVIFMGLKDLQDFLYAENRVSVISVLLSDFDRIEKVKKNFSDILNPKGLVVLGWDEVMVELKQTIDFDNASGILFLAFLIILVAFGILNTVSMSVFERFNEFGISLAIGFKNQKLALVVLFEVVIIAIIGIIIGCFLGGLVNYYIIKNPIVLTGEYASVYEDFGFEPKLVSSLNPRIFVNTALSILFISLISALVPVYRVYKLEPLKGIRYT
ncbi:ABC transporter permease [Candidatus Chrysopegis kryptomonas]|uniref:ABC-type transport system, involved in lipoprotein release, permease component n=1 Tax=Candidatus Chryseopegocella kryptomonas TaxID=1633643 RepID=A0A0N7MXL3_9BACT|nr:ABC transporter permease [Candidatus Chrysopegis kryptomonas]CUT01763.1 ABC-type transport system, involved in lipoprotein release, permease component [Candidatus Chrysopegis kryptomonas]